MGLIKDQKEKYLRSKNSKESASIIIRYVIKKKKNKKTNVIEDLVLKVDDMNTYVVVSKVNLVRSNLSCTLKQKLIHFL